MGSGPAECVNGYVDGQDLVLLARDGGRLLEHRRRAAWVSYFRRAELPGDIARQVAAAARECSDEAGGWWRVDFGDGDLRRGVCYQEVSRNRRTGTEVPNPLVRAGVAHYEADVDPVRRHFTDTGAAIQRPRRCYLDLETDSRVPFARKEDMRILSWALVDDAGRAACGVLPEDSHAAEAGLLGELWECLFAYDQVCGWNLDGFDAPVLFARSDQRNLRVDARRLLWADHMVAFRRMNMHAAESGEEKRSMALQSIATAILGRGKVPFDASKTWEAWRAGGEDRRRLAAYNLQDAQLMPDIERKTGYLDLFGTICEVCRLFPETGSLNPSRQMDGFMLRLARERGLHFPSRRFTPRWQEEGPQDQDDEDDEEEGKFRGAYVMQPKTVDPAWRAAQGMANGIARQVHVADFASLYPSIIISWNMSPDTKATDVFPNGPLPPGRSRAPLTGVGFRTDVEGLLPVAERQLLEMRKHWGDVKASLPPGTPEWHDADRRSNAYKVTANSFFGVTGNQYSRYHDRELAEGITQNGKWLIQQTGSAAEARGWQVIYADSVPGDRTVVVKDPHGDLDTVPIEELWDRSKSKVRRGDGKQVGSLAGWSALARDKRGEVGWYPIDSVVRHKVAKPLWKISTRHGQTEVTEDHGIVVGQEAVSPAEFLGRGMKFDCVRPPPLETSSEVDLWRYLKRAAFSFSYKGRVVVRRFELVDGDDWIVLGGWGSPVHKIRRRYVSGSSEMGALLRVFGAYISEGSSSIRGVTSCRYMFSISQNEEEWLESLKNDLDLVCPGLNVFGPHKTAGAYVIRSGTATISAAFATLCGFKSKGKKLPAFVHTLSDGDFAELWRLLVEGDGSVYLQVRSTQHGYTTISQRLAAGISYALAQRGFEHSIHYREAKGSWTIRTRPDDSERVNRRIIPKVQLRNTSGEEWVYDLSVPGAQTFVDGIGRVLLHNTDSIFVIGPTREEFSVFVQACNRDLYPELLKKVGCAENRIKLAYEKQFDRLLFTSAKRYVGRYLHYKGKAATAESKPEVKGLEFKRGDGAVLGAELQRAVVDAVLGGCEDPQRYHEMLVAARSRVLEGELAREHVVVSKALGKALKEYVAKKKKDGEPAAQPPHVTVAHVLKARGRDVSQGTRVEYVVVDAAAEDRAKRFLPAEDYDGRCDRHYLWEKLVYPPTQRLLEAAFPDQLAHWEAWARSRPPKPRRPRGAAPEGQAVLFSIGEPVETRVSTPVPDPPLARTA